MAEETERVAITTYVPAYQRERWREHAERLDMSQSEFVRAMVQAGRRGFDLEGANGSGDPDGATRNPVEPPETDATPRGNGLKTRVEAILREEGHVDWEELVAELTDDVESRLEDALSALQDENRVRYSGRGGGYRLVEGETTASEGWDDGE